MQEQMHKKQLNELLGQARYNHAQQQKNIGGTDSPQYVQTGPNAHLQKDSDRNIKVPPLVESKAKGC